jgi:hypothetical protein
LAAPIDSITQINDIRFTFSLLSLTSVGPGFEIVYAKPDAAVERVLFRVALDPKRNVDFSWLIRKYLTPATFRAKRTETAHPVRPVSHLVTVNSGAGWPDFTAPPVEETPAGDMTDPSWDNHDEPQPAKRLMAVA